MTDVSWHPYIVEDDEFRTLQFAEWDIQSKMRKSAPDELVLSYTQAMVAFMLFVEAPEHVLIAGLGGGSLLKYCRRHLPLTRLTAVEVCPAICSCVSRTCRSSLDRSFFRYSLRARRCACVNGRED